jgi:hypothetical protein
VRDTIGVDTLALQQVAELERVESAGDDEAAQVAGGGSDVLVGLALNDDLVTVDDDRACLGRDTIAGGLDIDPEASALDSRADNATGVLEPVHVRLSPGADVEPRVERGFVSAQSLDRGSRWILTSFH